MKYLTDIEKARLEFYKSHPEAIVRTIKPYTIAVCHRCHGEINLNHPSVLTTELRRDWTHFPYNYSTVSCPFCNVWSHSIRKISDHKINVRPINHTAYKIVEHVLKEKTNFWGKVIIVESIREIEEVYSHINPPMVN